VRSLALLDTQIVSLHQFHELSKLVGLRLTTTVLEVQLLDNARSSEHVVTACNPQLLEAKRLDQSHRVRKIDISDRTTRQSDKESRRLHEQRRYSAVVTSPGAGLDLVVRRALPSSLGYAQSDAASRPVDRRPLLDLSGSVWPVRDSASLGAFLAMLHVETPRGAAAPA